MVSKISSRWQGSITRAFKFLGYSEIAHCINWNDRRIFPIALSQIIQLYLQEKARETKFTEGWRRGITIKAPFLTCSKHCQHYEHLRRLKCLYWQVKTRKCWAKSWRNWVTNSLNFQGVITRWYRTRCFRYRAISR